jgi:hypothetical protein
MRAEQIRFVNGDVLSLKGLLVSVSADIYQTDLHYAICARLAAQLTEDPSLRQILENLFALKSSRVRTITAVAWLAQQRSVEIRCLEICDDIADALEELNILGVAVARRGRWKYGYVDARNGALLFLKALAHQLYRVFAKPLVPGRALVRAWVDVTEAMYPELIRTAELRIFPFPLSFARQLRFIRRCSRQGVQMSLDGLPYPILASWWVNFRGRNRDIGIAEIELKACRGYALQLVSAKPPTIHTSDEFEPGIPSLYGPVIAAGIKVVNTAHGVGWYCANVAYSEFRVYTKLQGDFYFSRNPDIQIEFRSRTNVRLPLDPVECSASSQVALVLIHQNFEDSRLMAEASALRRIAAEMLKAAQYWNIPLFIKLHPNTKIALKNKIKTSLGGVSLSSWESLRGFRPIFFVVNSTAFFETLEVGPTLVYSAPSFHPEFYYDGEFLRFTEDNLHEKVQQLVPVEAWRKIVAQRST